MQSTVYANFSDKPEAESAWQRIKSTTLSLYDAKHFTVTTSDEGKISVVIDDTFRTMSRTDINDLPQQIAAAIVIRFNSMGATNVEMV